MNKAKAGPPLLPGVPLPLPLPRVLLPLPQVPLPQVLLPLPQVPLPQVPLPQEPQVPLPQVPLPQVQAQGFRVGRFLVCYATLKGERYLACMNTHSSTEQSAPT